MQWGWWDNTKGTLVVTYPISFQTSNCKVICSGINVGTVNMHISSSPSPSQTGCSLATNNSSYWVSAYWIAVGIQQWGYYVGSKSKMYVPFHITFQSQCFTVIGCDAAISTTDTGGVDEAVYISDWSLTQFRVSISSDRNTISYIAFGIQQWGTFQDGTNWDTYFSFPIAFPTACYASCVTDIYNGDKNEDVYFREEPTTTKFRIRVGAGFSCPHLVIAIGKQQWGCTEGSPVAYPIAFTLICYIVRNGMQTSSSAGQAYERGVFAVTTTNFSRIYPSPQQSYIAIGIQQWGLVPHFSGSTNVVYPVAFSTHGHWVAAPRSSSTNDSIWCTGGWGGTLTGFSVATKGTEIEWIAIGYQQWGQYDEGSIVAEMNTTITFPVKFLQTCSISLITLRGNNSDVGTYGSIGAFDLASFYVHTVQIAHTGSRYIRWMAIGIQQWGYVSTSGINSQLTFSYPLTTTTIYCILLTHQRSDKSNHEANAYCISKNANSALIMAQRDYTFILIIAKQQWGVYSQNGVRSATVTLPIAFPNAAYNVSCTGKITAYEANTPGTNTISTTAFTYYCGTGNGGCWYIAFGKQQWGRNTTSATFPISFTSVPFSLACTCGNGQNNNYCPSPHQNNLTATGFTYGDRGYWWVVIGKQQWGVYDETVTGDNTPVITFNISYSSACWSVQVTSGEDDYTGNGWNYANSITKTGFNAVFAAGIGSWIALGVQQWGELQANAINTTITLPIAYKINHFAVVTSTTDSTGTGGLYTSNGCDRTLTTFRFACEATGGRLCCWISCGAQQWGVNTSSNGATISFPITFPNTVYTLVVTSNRRTTSTCANQGYVNNTSSFICYTDMTNGKGYWISAGKQQWGNITTAVNVGTVQLLISFQSDKYFATVDPMNDESYHTNNVGIYNRTKQSFGFTFYAGNMIRAWFCIGYQQWGLTAVTSLGEKTISFPLAFSNTAFTVLKSAYDSSLYMGNTTYTYGAVAALTTTSFKSYEGDILGLRRTSYIAIGMQQWGEGSYSTYTFPIAFTNTSYVFVSQMNLNFANAHYERNNYVTQKQITYITLGSASLNRFWTAIGY